jgi:ribonuclease VapC
MSIEVVSVTQASARRVSDDCFADELAKSQGCPLLYVGDDFAKTGIVSALPAATSGPPPGL